MSSFLMSAPLLLCSSQSVRVMSAGTHGRYYMICCVPGGLPLYSFHGKISTLPLFPRRGAACAAAAPGIKNMEIERFPVLLFDQFLVFFWRPEMLPHGGEETPPVHLGGTSKCL